MKENAILVAEDEPNDAFLLKRAFLAAGINANLQFVRDGEEAIDYLKGTNGFQDRDRFPLPRLILLDLKMPKVDGFEVLEWIRHNPKFDGIIVVVFTSSKEPKDIRKAYKLRANSYLQKPLSKPTKELAQLLNSYWMETNLY